MVASCLCGLKWFRLKLAVHTGSLVTACGDSACVGIFFPKENVQKGDLQVVELNVRRPDL